MKRRTKGHAFTLVELLVAFVIGTMTLVTLWMLMRSFSRHSVRISRKLDGLDSTLGFVRAFENDLLSLCHDSNHGVKTGLGEISFFVYEATRKELRNRQLPTRQVTYRFIEKDHKIVRQVAGEKKKTIPGAFVSLRFSLVELTKKKAYALSYSVSAVAHDALKGKKDIRVGTLPTTLWNRLPLRAYNDAYRLPHWHRSPASWPTN